MDTSETYIKMCEKAEEIQGGHIFIEGDWFFYNGKAHSFCEYGWSVIKEESNVIWLPRQDQLQEMMRGSDLIKWSDFRLLSHFAGWVSREEGHSFNFDKASLGRHPSMEQLWLAFVMKEKYNKIWDGDLWKEKK